MILLLDSIQLRFQKFKNMKIRSKLVASNKTSLLFSYTHNISNVHQNVGQGLSSTNGMLKLQLQKNIY